MAREAYGRWLEEADEARSLAEDVVDELGRLRQEAQGLLERLEWLIMEGVRGEVAREALVLGEARHAGHIVWRLCQSWARLVGGFNLECDPEVRAVCSAFLRSEELPNCPTY